MAVRRVLTQDSPQPTSVAEIVARARAAQATVDGWAQDRIDEAVAAIGWRALRPQTARRLTSAAVAETGFGSAEDSFAQFERRVRGTLCDLHGVMTRGLIGADPALGLTRYAKPVGVVGALTPSTGPIAAIVVNALDAVKTRNAIVVCPNPSVEHAAGEAVALIRASLASVDAPEDLAQIVERPDRTRSGELAALADLVVATGGAETVRRAAVSGRPVYAGGPGNAVIIVDETADLAAAADAIVAGKTFDNGTSCSAESCALIAAEVAESFHAALAERDAHLCDASEGARLRRALWPQGRLARAVVGRPAAEIARLAGIEVSANVRVLAAQLDLAAQDDPLGGEKLCPVLGIATYETFAEAVALTRRLLSAVGRGHSCGIHTGRPERVAELAGAVEASRVMANQSTGLGNTGSFSNGMPFTTTITCGPWGGGITNENVSWRHFLNYTTVSEPIVRRVPDDAELFAPYLARSRDKA